MKPTKTLPVLFAVVLTIASGAAIATAQNAPADGPAAASAASDQPTRAHFRAQRKDGDHRGFEGRGFDGHGFGRRGGSGMMQQLFGQVDADGNGSVTQEEIDAFRTAKVSAADASGDGALSIEEFDTIYREMTRTRMVRAFQSLDTDGDGNLTAEEMDARFGAIVERMDRNGDGAISMEDRGRGDGRKGERRPHRR